MTKKEIYRHKKTGALFAIETDGEGKVVSTSGPLLMKEVDAKELDYDNYWDEEIREHLGEFVLLSKGEYEEALKKAGLFVQESQRSIFEELNRRKKLRKEKKKR